MSETSRPESGSIASVGKRIGGGLVDLVVSFVLIMVIGAFSGFGAAGGGEDGATASVNVSGLPFVLMALSVFVLFGLLEWKLGKTPGKMLLKTKVVSESGEPPTFLAALLRNVLRLIDGIGLYLVGLVVLAIDSKNRRLGDLLARTQVVND